MEPGISWNLADVSIAVLAAGAAAYGYYRGFLMQLVSVAGFILALVTAYLLFDETALALRRLVPLSGLKAYDKYAFWVEGLNLDVYAYNAIAFALLFAVAKLVLALAGRLLNLLSKLPVIHGINRWSGALLGLLEAALIAVIAVHVLSIVPADSVQRVLAQSHAAHVIMERMPDAALALRQLWSG